MEQIIYSNSTCKIIKKENDYLIEVMNTGANLKDIQALLAASPSIKVVNFIALRSEILAPSKIPVKFGEHLSMKDRIKVEISSDELSAYISVNASEQELSGDEKNDFINIVLEKLKEAGVVFGIDSSILLQTIRNSEKYLVAKGIPPTNGRDSVVKMYELKEQKPEIQDDGNVDFYEMSLINKVDKGDWLGQRIDGTLGIDGKSVKGKDIKAMPGKVYPLLYEKSSVEEVYEDGVTTLKAIRNGAVYYLFDRISVSNHLEITGDIDFKTGNVDFDGHLSVKGTITDNFSVYANEDIEINGQYGVGAVKEICSREGNIYIKGGIAGKNKAIIKSKKNIYTKFISDATIICDGIVHIGFYCLNSNITAKEVLLESTKSQIMGGNIKAEIKVTSSVLGSSSEKRTNVNVVGFDRIAMMSRFETVGVEIETLKKVLFKLKQELAIYLTISQERITQKQIEDLANLKDKVEKFKIALLDFEIERKEIAKYLKTRGEGEVVILKKAFPNTCISIKNIPKEISMQILGTTFYYQDGVIKQV